MHQACARSTCPTSGRNDNVRKNLAIVLIGDMREDQAMAPRRHRVASILIDGMSTLEPAVSAEVFGTERDWLGVTWYQHTFCAEVPGPVHLVGGMDVTVTAGLEALAKADTIILPGWCTTSDALTPTLIDAMQRAYRRGARLVSFCTGAYALAGAGLLDGRRATTHWTHAERFAARFPAVDLDPNVLFVDEDRILSSAGSAASMDLALYVVRLDFGAEIANLLARDLVVPPHRDGGQAQYIESPVPTCAEGDELSETLAWASAHLADDLSLEVLAEHSTMSPRTFSRRFREATGTTPLRWVTNQRLALAQRLLESTDLSIDLVAESAGLGTAASLRLHFQRHLRTSPQAYRRTFQCAESA
jgi:AraC family transcriptional activator FtrA